MLPTQMFGPCQIAYSFDGSPGTSDTNGSDVNLEGFEIAGIVIPVVTLGLATSISVARIEIAVKVGASDVYLPMSGSSSISNLLGALSLIVAPIAISMSPAGSAAQGGPFRVVGPKARIVMKSVGTAATAVKAGFILRRV